MNKQTKKTDFIHDRNHLSWRNDKITNVVLPLVACHEISRLFA